MKEWPGNVFAEIELALKEGKKGMTLNTLQLTQILTLMAEVTEGKNAVVRENIELRAKLESK